MERNLLTIFLGPQETLEASGGGQMGHEVTKSSGARPRVGEQACGPLIAPLTLILLL